MGSSFIEDNTVSRRRLEALVARLSDEDLSRTTSYGWTVAALLAHLAFWDRRVQVLLSRWKEQGVDESPVDSGALNDALRPLLTAIDPRTSIQLCLTSAREVDAELESLSPILLDQIEDLIRTTPTQFRFNRSLHRNGHLDDIERLLETPSVPGAAG